MPSLDNDDEMFAPKSHFLSATATLSRKSSSKQMSSRRSSNTSLRASPTLAHAMDEESATGRHSLAHELAVALMPEPSAGSKMLAEEFGIEYDEGAEGIDKQTQSQNGVQFVVTDGPPFADELNGEGLHTPTMSTSFHGANASEDTSREVSESEEEEGGVSPDIDPMFGSPSKPKSNKPSKPEQDPMLSLAQDLEFTDKFLAHLRRIDTDPTSAVSQQPALERMASDVIRKINQTARDREGQLRELLEYEREFRKIAGEVGGTEVLGQLEELTDLDDEQKDSKNLLERGSQTETRALAVVEEEDENPTSHNMPSMGDWELDPDRNHLGDDDYDQPERSPAKDNFPLPPTVEGPITPSKAIPQLAHLRSFTSSLLSSLSTISEQAQVNGAATTEAGRKIRALKNKLGGLRTDWDSAERSRIRIDRWEAGLLDVDSVEVTPVSPTTSSRPMSRRVDGRVLVEEHLRAFELALADAAVKTKAIMAA